MGAVWDYFVAHRKKDNEIEHLEKMSYINFLLKQVGLGPMKMRVIHDGQLPRP